MNDIADSSQQIAHITGVIDSIAFQTNILALNAAAGPPVPWNKVAALRRGR
ncbi:MAG: methyl-accepting chemotaxis protein [Enterobacter hormaechei]